MNFDPWPWPRQCQAEPECQTSSSKAILFEILSGHKETHTGPTASPVPQTKFKTAQLFRYGKHCAKPPWQAKLFQHIQLIVVNNDNFGLSLYRHVNNVAQDLTNWRSDCGGNGANNTCGDRTPRGIAWPGINDWRWDSDWFRRALAYETSSTNLFYESKLTTLMNWYEIRSEISPLLNYQHSYNYSYHKPLHLT